MKSIYLTVMIVGLAMGGSECERIIWNFAGLALTVLGFWGMSLRLKEGL